jgi:coenzyme F420-reducing hydrogenase alpha subunit
MPEPEVETTTIEVGALARVEGEGALHVRVRGGDVESVRLEIFEPPRFFEALLRGRRFSDAPDITSRICGICPIAYQLSACAAIEDALGIEVSEPIRQLRRLIYCGEWLESHALHVFMLHAPDFLGYPGAVEMANDGHATLVERGLAIKQAGNRLIAAIGGRSVHPVNPRVGGFYRAPSAAELAPVAEPLQYAREQLIETVAWAGTLDFPERHLGAELAALRQDERGGEYPLEGGRLVSTAGLDIDAAHFPEHVVEEQVAHSTALHARLLERGNYVLGPIARHALNRDRLSPVALEAAEAAGLEPVCRNPFKSIVVRSVEMLYAADEALRLLADYEPPAPAAIDAEPIAATGSGWTEAPRGMLWHRYELDSEGRIAKATIVPPTSQNQAAIEADLREYVQENLELLEDDLRWRCEQAVRNYDPCISCSTHFLRLDIDRR